MNFGNMLGGLMQGTGNAMQKNAEELKGGTAAPQQSPTSAFVQAARQAALERQQAAASQVQTAPTALAATQGGAMSAPMGGNALQMQGAPVAAQTVAPPGGMLTQGQPDPQALAAMFRGR
jgi:hypothetical protein